MVDKFTYPQFMTGFNQAYGQYGNNWYGTSILDQYRNADKGLGYIRDNYDKLSDEAKTNADSLMSGMKAQKGQAVASGIATGLSGLSSIAGTALQSAQINDTSDTSARINDLGNVGLYGYSSYDQLQRDYNDTNFNTPISYRDIRGMSGMEKAGAIGSSTLSGAMTGLQIGGPWGALAGAVIGAGAGVGGVLAGDTKARVQTDFLSNQAQIAANDAMANMGVAADYLGDRGARWRQAHMVAEGGKIHKQSLQQFADRVLGKGNPVGAPQTRLVKTYCKGGVKISIKK